jgi:hypothetical protein
MCIENDTMLGYCDDETLERAALTTLAAERRLLDPESLAALEALSSCWRRQLPRVWRYNALKKHGALRFLNQKAMPPERVRELNQERTRESHPAFFRMLEYTLQHRRPEQTLRLPLEAVVGTAHPMSTKTLVGFPIPSTSDHEAFPLTRRVQ